MAKDGFSRIGNDVIQTYRESGMTVPELAVLFILYWHTKPDGTCSLMVETIRHLCGGRSDSWVRAALKGLDDRDLIERIQMTDQHGFRLANNYRVVGYTPPTDDRQPTGGRPPTHRRTDRLPAGTRTASPQAGKVPDKDYQIEDDQIEGPQSADTVPFKLSGVPEPPAAMTVDPDDFLACWNDAVDGTPIKPIRDMTPKRLKMLAARVTDRRWCRDWRTSLGLMATSKFCRGEEPGKPWTANPTWFLRSGDAVNNLMEGQYQQNGRAGAGGRWAMFEGTDFEKEIPDDR